MRHLFLPVVCPMADRALVKSRSIPLISIRGESIMSDRRTEFGFERTVCDCEACKLGCRFLPGFLVPSDLHRIAEHLGYSSLIKFALENLLASPGALVIDRGKIRRIRTLVTARRDGGACLFLDEQNRCRIHSVSQFGCSFFDTHQTKEEAGRRSSAGHGKINNSMRRYGCYYTPSAASLRRQRLRAPGCGRR
jgi:hypothetical protein